MESNSVADKGDRRKAELPDLAEIEIIDRTARCARFDGIEQEIFAFDQIGPNSFGMGRRRADGGRAADAGMVAADDGKYLDAADGAARKDTLGRTDIRKD